MLGVIQLTTEVYFHIMDVTNSQYGILKNTNLEIIEVLAQNYVFCVTCIET